MKTVETDLEAKLKDLGKLSDVDFPVMEALLLLGFYEQPFAEKEKYRGHRDALHKALEKEIAAHPSTDGGNVPEWRLNRLNAVLRHQFNYSEDTEEFGAIDTINMMSVMDRRKGLPVALGALYIDLAHSQKWPAFGLNFPGHFLISLDHGAHRLIVDPYHGGMMVNAGRMRQLLKAVKGKYAELRHAYYEPVTPREVVLRFYNNKKTRLIGDKRYAEALVVAQRMLWIAPQEPRLYFDCGVLSIKVSHIKNALEYLGKFMTMSHDKKSLTEAQHMIDSVRSKLQ